MSIHPPSDAAMRAAREILPSGVGAHEIIDAAHKIDRHIAQALAHSERPVQKGFIRTSDGVDRRVLGRLPLTKDGCLIGDDCKIWFQSGYVNAEPFRSSLPGESGWYPFRCDHTYSTMDAALFRESAHQSTTQGESGA